MLQLLKLLVPLLLHAIKPNDLLCRQLQLILEARIAESTVALVLHLELAKTLLLKRVGKCLARSF